MFVQSITALMIASLAIAQTPVPAPQMSPPARAEPRRLPRGKMRRRLPSQAHHRSRGNGDSAHVDERRQKQVDATGDTVRAVVAFPVTIGTQLAIPAGTFVDGDVSQVTARPKAGQQPSFRVHFTRLVFSNGYSVALNGENTQALRSTG